ncbi:hypothetical protein SDC9_56724 [bioreactor metagenome]|uniref:Uncharacterized protein n=1 Tax=bioreactor metagenome TaxID=1076179 RepID=A0A644X7Y8_9ZZZZ
MHEKADPDVSGAASSRGGNRTRRGSPGGRVLRPFVLPFGDGQGASPREDPVFPAGGPEKPGRQGPARGPASRGLFPFHPGGRKMDRCQNLRLHSPGEPSFRHPFPGHPQGRPQGHGGAQARGQADLGILHRIPQAPAGPAGGLH